MASSQDFRIKLLQLMECSICLENLKNAKVLHCAHSFCKNCLDKLLEFNPDGSANITCPLRCDGITFIEKKKTTNDLLVPVQFKNLMEMLDEENDEVKPQKKFCCDGSHCAKELSSCCSFCYAKLCHTCKYNHMHDVPFHFFPIKYESGNVSNILPWCEEHHTFSTYACQDGLICLYCKERGHTNHRYDSIDVLSQQILTWVKEQNPNTSAIEGLFKKLKDITETEIQLIRDKLISTLKSRKIICMKNYMDHLNQEESRLISNFETITSKHFESYPSHKPIDYVNDIPRFQVFLDRDRIFENVRHISLGNASIPRINISLSDSLYNSTNPLGEIHETRSEAILSNEELILPSVSSNIILDEVGDFERNSLLDDVTALLGTNSFVKKKPESTMKKVSFLDFLEDNETQDDASTEILEVDSDSDEEPSAYSEEELERIISHLKQNDHNSLNYMWGYMGRKDDIVIGVVKKWKDILRVKGTLEETLLHFAARDGRIKLMKYLLRKKLIDPNVSLSNRSTPLHLAASNSRLECVKLLVEYKANSQIINKNGKTAMDLATSSEIKQFLSACLA